MTPRSTSTSASTSASTSTSTSTSTSGSSSGSSSGTDWLERLLRPKSIAVFGGDWAANVVQQCLRFGYAGQIWPVHPTRDEMHGLRCFRSIDELPGVPDASFVGVNAEATISVVAALAAGGAGGAVCFATGFEEVVAEDAEGADRQRRLLAAAGSMPLIGPNCYGYVNCLDGAVLWPDQHGATRVERGVALLAQSSNIAINLGMQRRGLPVAMILTAGNQAQLSLATLAASVIEDARVTALGLYVEGFGDLRAWETLADRADALGKSVVVLKAGRSDAARGAMLSHTRSLAGTTAASDAFVERLGLHRVQSLGTLLETLKILHLHGPLRGSRVLSMSCSGGEAALLADGCAAIGLQCPALDQRQEKALRGALGPGVALANPLDYNTWIWNDPAALEPMMSAMLLGEADAAVLVLDLPREDRCDAASWHVTIEAFVRASRRWPGAACLLSTLDENLPEATASALLAAGVVPLHGIENGLAALAAARRTARIERAPCALPPAAAIDPIAEVFVDEADTKARLTARGVSVPLSRVATLVDAGFVDACLDDLRAPLVVKARGLAHKSESGAVVLDIGDRKSLVAALARVATGEGGVVVEEQVRGVVAELLVGIVVDPVHGWLLTIGAGGLFTELFRDTASALLPVDATRVRERLSRLRIAPVLAGYRGRPAANQASIVDAVLRIQELALAIGDDLIELEINPLLCTPTSAVVADAMMRVRRTELPFPPVRGRR